jgi:hypothetical protein
MERTPKEEIAPRQEIEARNEPGLEWAASAMEHFGDVGDKEAVFMLALTLGHPEWEAEMLRQVKEYKPHVSDPEGLLIRIKADFEASKNMSEQNGSFIEVENSWMEHIPAVKERLSEINAYFNAEEGEYPRKVILVPAEGIIKTDNSGSSFHVGDAAVILSHAGNLDNVGHEFLHGMINPMTEELKHRLPEEKILALASDRYKIDDMYGEHALSLLNEELIRTYNDIIRSDGAPPSPEEFKKKIESLTDETFAHILTNEPHTGKRLKNMGINTLKEFQERSVEYYERYIKNELRERIYGLYREFEAKKEVQPDLKFKDFFAGAVDRLFA